MTARVRGGVGRHRLGKGPYAVAEQGQITGQETDFGSLIVPVSAAHHVAVSGASARALDTVIITWLAEGATLALTAYATPRSGGYRQVAEAANRSQVAEVGALAVRDRTGPLGTEMTARMGNGGHRTFFTMEGPCWVLRAVLHSRPGRSYADRMRARSLLAAAGVRRGTVAYPPGESLPISMPQDWAADDDVSSI